MKYISNLILTALIVFTVSPVFGQAETKLNPFTRKLQWVYPSLNSLTDTDTNIISPGGANLFLKVNSAGDSITTDTGIVASGSDGDSSTTQSDSGLETIGGNITILRGCSDGQLMKWVESTDLWKCAADATGGGGANLWETMTGDTGSVAANSTTDVFGIVGEDGSPISTRISGDNVIINSTPHLWTQDTALTLFQKTAGDMVIEGNLNINLQANENIVIDGRTHPREITQGIIRVIHTPESTTENTRAMFMDIDYNSVPNTEAIHMGLKSTDMAAGETMIGLDIEGDINASSGGVIRAINVSKIPGEGSGEVEALHVEPEVDNVIHHSSGSFISVLQGWDENGGFTDTTTAFNSTGTNVTIFDANADAIYIGLGSAFSVIEYVLSTAASNPGIKPTFEYSSGGGTPVWTTFTPTDGTAGFREDGLITWDIDDLVTPTWAVATVNGQSAFYIQITRTQVNLGTDPIESLFEVSTPTEYLWTGAGVLFVESVTTGVNSRTVTSEGSAETVEIISHINDAFSETVEFTAMRHSDTTASGAVLYGIRSRGTHTSQAVVQDNDVLFWLRIEGHDGTDFNDAASIFFKVDGAPGADDMPGRIEFYTSPDGSNALVKRAVIDSTGLFTIEGLTGSEILATDASKGLVSLAVATYPSLTELIHVKGVTSAIQTQIDSKGAHAGQVWTGDQNFGGAVFEITNSATPTTDATGEIALDTTITDHQPLLQYFDGGENMTVIAIDTAQLPALDNELIKYDAATDKFVLEADVGSGLHQICFTMGSDGTVLTTGEKMWIRVVNSFTIGTAEVTAQPSGSCVIDIWKDSYANFPPTVADTITASAKPTISGADQSQDSTLTGWTTSVTAGDYLLPNVDSCSTVERLTVCLYE